MYIYYILYIECIVYFIADDYDEPFHIDIRQPHQLYLFRMIRGQG